MPTESQIQSAYDLAKERYAALGVDTDAALARLEKVAISLHCWQGDDVGGFENPGGELSGGIAATGNYPGKARTADELRSDLDVVYQPAARLAPAEPACHLSGSGSQGGAQRDRAAPLFGLEGLGEGQRSRRGFQPDLLLASQGRRRLYPGAPRRGIRQFWIEHCIASRKIGEYFGKELGTPAVTNIWIPDGYKDTPADRQTPRRLLLESLDAILAEKIDPRYNLDAVEPKLFGIGSESYVVGSMEFYTAYALSRKMLLTLDAGHFHPTETIADKISSLLLYLDRAAAARQPRRALGQRPRGDLQR